MTKGLETGLLIGLGVAAALVAYISWGDDNDFSSNTGSGRGRGSRNKINKRNKRNKGSKKK